MGHALRRKPLTLALPSLQSVEALRFPRRGPTRTRRTKAGATKDATTHYGDLR
jgi:hypothetical protein